MLGRYSYRKLWDEKPVLWLMKKRLQTFQWVQERFGFKTLNFVFMCARSAEQLGERTESVIRKVDGNKWQTYTQKKGKLRTGRTKACNIN